MRPKSILIASRKHLESITKDYRIKNTSNIDEL